MHSSPWAVVPCLQVFIFSIDLFMKLCFLEGLSAMLFHAFVEGVFESSCMNKKGMSFVRLCVLEQSVLIRQCRKAEVNFIGGYYPE